MSLDALKQQGLTASNVNDGTEMTFDLHKGNGTGSAYYDGWLTYSLSEINSELDTNLYSILLSIQF